MDKQQTKRAKKKRSGEKTIRFRCDYSSTPLKVLESRGWTRVFDPKDRRWDLWWCDTSEIKAALDCASFQRLRSQQRVAHFLNHGELTRKNLLYRNLRRYKRTLLKAGKAREAALCDIMPVSFELPSEYRMLVEEYRRSQGATWIVKPAAGSQGRGIFLFRRLRDLAEWRSREYPPPGPDAAACEGPECPAPPDIHVVQRYIDDPYLLGGCKFDMRIYVLVTSFQPLKVWLAREGFARLSGEQFSLERIDDSRVHLTNMSIQLKAAAATGKEASHSNGKAPPGGSGPSSPRQPGCAPPAKLGSKWPLSCLRQYLTERHGSAVVEDLLHNIAVPSHIGKASASKKIEEDCNKENELNGTNGVNAECSEESKSNVQETQEVAVEKPVKVQNVTKTLRIGWLNKPAGATRYRKVTRPRGGVKKLKLDATTFYTAHQIKMMAVEAFEAGSGEERAIGDEYAVTLGDFGGKEIAEFRRRDGRLCDIWEYCEDRGERPYQLSLYLLTSPAHEAEPAQPICERTISTRRTKARPRVVNDVRVFYQYTRRSCYTNELSYVEFEKPELHGRVLEDQCGDGPPLEHFEPPDHGFAICRVEQAAGRPLLQVWVDDEAAVESVEFPAARGVEEHGVAHDADQLQGYCDGKFGLGFVPSCTNACRPLFSWYRDGALFKRAEYLYWLNNVKDERPHRWSCTVACHKTGRLIKSKEVLIEALED